MLADRDAGAVKCAIEWGRWIQEPGATERPQAGLRIPYYVVYGA